MEFLFAAVAIVVVLGLARRAILHPGDYLVTAALALHLAVFVVVLSPSVVENRLLIGHGMPDSAVARSQFLLAHGFKIEVAAVIFAVAACVAALLRRRATPEQFA